MIDELRGGGGGGGGALGLRGAKVFISSDSQRLVNETVRRYGAASVLAVRGDAFQHTDTLNAHKINAAKFARQADGVVARAYLLTMANHYLIGLSRHVVMAQSGFGDTAFWRGRRAASCLFMDMTRSKLGWRHSLAYCGGAAGDAACEQLPGGKGGGGCGCPAVAARSSGLVVTDAVSPLYAKDNADNDDAEA
jgi:hypothetical protein